LEQLVETEHRNDISHHGAKTESEVATSSSNDGNDGNDNTTPPRKIPAKKTFLQSMAVFTGKYTNDNMFALIVGTFVTLLNIGACWSTICSGLLTTWYVTTAIIQAGIFAGPPWNFDAAQIGYLSTGPFVGGAVGSAMMAFTTDPSAKWLTRGNNGISTPPPLFPSPRPNSLFLLFR
jgi:hypothetical protein